MLFHINIIHYICDKVVVAATTMEIDVNFSIKILNFVVSTCPLKDDMTDMFYGDIFKCDKCLTKINDIKVGLKIAI